MLVVSKLFSFVGLSKNLFFENFFLRSTSSKVYFCYYSFILGFRGTYFVINLDNTLFFFRKILHLFFFLSKHNGQFCFLIDKSYGDGLNNLIYGLALKTSSPVYSLDFFFKLFKQNYFNFDLVFFLCFSFFYLFKFLKLSLFRASLFVSFIDFSLCSKYALPYSLPCNLLSIYSLYFFFDILGSIFLLGKNV